MTLPPLPDVASDPASLLAHQAAAACASLLPASEPLGAGEAQPGSEQVAQLFAAAVTADLVGVVSGSLTLLVGEEVTTMLRDSPLGRLEVAGAVQPALDAAAAALGCTAGAGTALELDLVAERQGGAFTVVPLLGEGIVAALLAPATTLAAALARSLGAPGASGTGPVAELRPGSVDADGVIVTTPPSGATVTRPGAAVLPITQGRRGIEMLNGVEMELTVELGRARISVRELLALAPGTVLALDRAAGAPADLLVNGRPVARGEVVVVDEDFGLRVTEILDHTAAV